MTAEVDDVAEEVLEITNLALLGEDEFGLVMHIVLTGYENSPSPENMPEITNQGEAVYNADFFHS